MIKAISNVDNNSKNKSVSFSSQSKSLELPHAKKMNTLSKDEFKLKGLVCGIDFSFEDS
jgi:hypothetical protein